MNSIYVKARAKINISLDVTGKRGDGYHNIETVMQTLELHDDIFIKRIYKKDYFKLITNVRWLPVNGKNLVSKAYEAIRERYEFSGGIFVELRKNIPVSAGLAGGSADCAATLIALKKLFGLPISKTELLEIGASLGADVPFCMEGGTMLANGIGERLTRLSPHPFVYVLLVKPPVIVSTADVFRNFKTEKVGERPDTGKIIRYIEEKDAKNIASGFCNVLESVTCEKYPLINILKSEMVRYGALGSLMSGSGPTVFGYFKTFREAAAALEKINAAHPEIDESRITKISNYHSNPNS